jgi:hypothetical protein
LVWCAIYKAGFISQPYIGVIRGDALNAERYIQRCFSKLRRFWNTHHTDDEIMFWQNLATWEAQNEEQLRRRISRIAEIDVV